MIATTSSRSGAFSRPEKKENLGLLLGGAGKRVYSLRRLFPGLILLSVRGK